MFVIPAGPLYYLAWNRPILSFSRLPGTALLQVTAQTWRWAAALSSTKGLRKRNRIVSQSRTEH